MDEFPGQQLFREREVAVVTILTGKIQVGKTLAKFFLPNCLFPCFSTEVSSSFLNTSLARGDQIFCQL